jgi:hypothetical protein
MANLIYSAISSLDGYIADVDGKFDWAEPDDEVHAFINDLARPIGTYLLGRRMFEVLRRRCRPVLCDAFGHGGQGATIAPHSDTVKPRERPRRTPGPLLSHFYKVRTQQLGWTQRGSVSASIRCGEPTGMSRNVTQNSRLVVPTFLTRCTSPMGSTATCPAV